MSATTTANPSGSPRTIDPRALAAAERSPGLWQLAWKRLMRDKVAVIAMFIVIGFIVLSLLSFFGLVAKDWGKEVGINYAPPVFAPNAEGGGLDAPTVVTAPSQTGDKSALPFTFTTGVKDPLEAEMKEIYAQLGRGGAVPAAQSGAPVYQSTIVDPLAEDIAAIRKELGRPDPSAAAIPAAQISAYKGNIVDPLAEDVAAINKELGRTGAVAGAMAVAAVAEKKIERSPTLAFGGDKWGRDVLAKVIKGSETSILVGFAAAIVATLIGTLLGALAGYYGGWVDDVLNWFYSIFSAIPYLLLILAIAAVVNKKGVLTIVLILGLTGWASIFRLVRAEYMKHKSREYVQAATALGASNWRKMFVHIFPNVSHVALVQLSLHVVLFIKSEVILSFLGFGVGVDTVSWGSMLNEAQSELILGKWWQLGAATLFMAVLVTAFSLFTDALRDALDPKLK
jgi:peptide/nickel transport system permease protein